MTGKNAGYLLELVNGISKFRVAGAESRAFSAWATRFTEQRHLTYRVREIENRLSVFNALYPLVALWVVFALVQSTAGSGEDGDAWSHYDRPAT